MPVSRLIPLALLSSALLSGCYSDRLDSLESRINALHAELRLTGVPRLDGGEQRLRRIEHDLQMVASGVFCRDERVRTFLSDCRSSAGCRTDNFEANLAYMAQQPHIMAYLDPRRGAASLTDLRRGQLLRLVNQQVLLTSTRLLVVTMPVPGMDGQEAETREPAEHLALQLRALLIRLHPQLRELNLLMPQNINCSKTTREFPRLFARQNPADRPEPAEPTARQPHVAAWIFLLNC